METLMQDLKFAVRSLRKHPGFAAIAVATLAVGIGANAAMFAVVNAVILKPLPFPAPDRLVRVTADNVGFGAIDIGVSAPELYDYRDRSDLFEAISGIYPIDANLTEVDEPERVEILLVSPTYFSLLGARPQLGRIFDPAVDNHPGIAEVVVISDGLWKRRFGGRPDVLSRKLRIDGDLYEIVGVMPPDFHHPGPVLRTGIEMWAPSGYSAAPFAPLAKTRNGYSLSGAIARLKPGLTLAEAQNRLDAFAARVRAEHPNEYPARAAWTPRMIDLHDDVVGRSRSGLFMMLVAVGVVLTIACANIAGLLLARGAGRQRELGIRRALGAGRLQLVRLLLAESFVLACGGGVAGLLLSFWTKDVILAIAPLNLPRIGEVGIDLRVVAFAAAVAAITGVIFGLVPALQFSKPDVLAALKDSRAAAVRERQTVRSVLVVAEFALAMVLLVGAALLVRSFWRLLEVDPGIDGRGVLTARLWLPQPNEPSQGRYFTHKARLSFYQEVLRRARELPGVESAAIVQNLPLDGQRRLSSITIDGGPSDASDVPSVQVNVASDDYFSVMRIPVRQGRIFNSSDLGGNPVVLINDEAARRHFNGQNPIGRRLHFGRPRPDAFWMTVVGVVGNVLSESLEIGPRPMIYLPLSQSSSLSMAIAIRATVDPEALAVPLSRAVRSVDPDQPTFALRTMEGVQAAGTASRRFAIQLVGGFAVLALVLAAIGIYGVIAYLVGQRTKEIGIRIALGAKRREVMTMVVGRAVWLAIVGVTIGTVASLGVSQLVAGMLFQVRPSDPWTFATIAALLTLTAVAAAAAPAFRAAHLDPVIALRAE
jgi:putative ABC transport system permease protein